MTVKHDFIFVCQHHLANMCYFSEVLDLQHVAKSVSSCDHV